MSHASHEGQTWRKLRVDNRGVEAKSKGLVQADGGCFLDDGQQPQNEFNDSTFDDAAGVFNGTPDGRDGANPSPGNELEIAGRLSWEPFKHAASALSGLGFGVAGGKQEALLSAGNVHDDPDHRAWQVTAGHGLAGEDAGCKNVVKPNHSFTFDRAGWGAFELVARNGELTIDRDAFLRFGDAKTDSEGGVANDADREGENAFFTHAQFS